MQAQAVLQDTCPPGGDSETQLLGSLEYWICRLIKRLLNAPQQGSEWGDSERNFATSGHSVTASLMALHKYCGGRLLVSGGEALMSKHCDAHQKEV